VTGELTYEQWLDYGIQHDYCSPPFCDTHEGVPLTDTEIELWDTGVDPCALAVRLGYYQDWELEAQGMKEMYNNDI